MSLIKQNRGISVLLDLVGNRLITGGSKANNFVVVSDELMATGGGLTLGNSLDATRNGDGRFEGKSGGLVSVGKITRKNDLEEART